MGQAAIHFDDLIKDATLTATSEAGTLAVGNLQNYQPKKVWRSTDIEETLIADFGQVEYCPATWLIRHNLSAQALVRIRLSNNADLSSPVYDATFYAWPSIEGYDEGVYDGSRFVGYDGAPVTSRLPAEVFNSTFILPDTGAALSVAANDETYAGRYLGVTVTDGGADQGYLQAGVWRAGTYTQPDYDISFGRSFGFQDPSQRLLSHAQDIWVSARNKNRVEQFSFDFLSEQEVNSDFFFMGLIAGASRPVIYMPFVENSFRSLIGTIYGLLDESPRIQQVRKRFDHYSYSATISIRGL